MTGCTMSAMRVPHIAEVATLACDIDYALPLLPVDNLSIFFPVKATKKPLPSKLKSWIIMRTWYPSRKPPTLVAIDSEVIQSRFNLILIMIVFCITFLPWRPP
ncbi:hypothetical protein BDZ91DRAFT_790884 [Kalaharituber pfeilii]|nr:hypothetical protein BDZ91DRAFT_790884 [Kalaharituber pfeilii]